MRADVFMYIRVRNVFIYGINTQMYANNYQHV